MKIAIMHSAKKRNNARSNLGLGLEKGFASIPDVEVIMAQDMYEMSLGTHRIPKDVSAIILPYWISEKIWENDIWKLRESFPNVPILVYTGTSPYWHGCNWVDFDPGTKELTPKFSGNALKSFNAVDAYMVVRPRGRIKPSNQYAVGMGLFEEIKPPENKPATPCVIVDFFKRGWDESQYRNSLITALESVKDIPKSTVAVLGNPPNDLVGDILSEQKVRVFFGEHHNWSMILGLIKGAWAMVSLNESFGYSIVESFGCGTQVFADTSCEIPAFHNLIEPLEKLSTYMHQMYEISQHETGLNDMAKLVKDGWESSNQDLVSWNTCARNVMDVINQVIFSKQS